jgi:hypothetical protein
MKVGLYVRISSGAKRRYVPVNKNKLYRDGTVFCLRHGIHPPVFAGRESGRVPRLCNLAGAYSPLVKGEQKHSAISRAWQGFFASAGGSRAKELL